MGEKTSMCSHTECLQSRDWGLFSTLQWDKHWQMTELNIVWKAISKAASINKHFTCLENNVTGQKPEKLTKQSTSHQINSVAGTPQTDNSDMDWQHLNSNEGLTITPGLQGTPLGWVWEMPGSEELPPGSSKAKARRLNSIFKRRVYCKENDR